MQKLRQAEINNEGDAKGSLGRKIDVGFALAILIFFFIGIISYQNNARLAKVAETADQTSNILLKIKSVLAGTKDIETNARGFILTGQRDSLDRYYTASVLTEQKLKELRRLTSDNTTQQRWLDLLGPMLDKKSAGMTKIIETRQKDGLDAALKLYEASSDEQSMDDVRKVLDEMETEENELLRQRAKEEVAHNQRTASIIVFICVLAFLPIALASFVVNNDITGRRRIEKATARLTQELIRSNKELEQFAHMASHDLQEPLRMIITYTQLLSKKYQGKLDADAEQYIRFAVDGAGRMQRMIDSLMAYSRVETKIKDFSAVNVETVLTRALGNLKGALNGAVVTHDPLPTLTGDEHQLIELFQNLLENAAKFHGLEELRVHVSCSKKGGEWVFSVQDNGIGIDPRYFDRLFVVFQRLHPASQYPGAGLGLAICKKIVERHNGRIWVESAPDKGSTFYFSVKQEKN